LVSNKLIEEEEIIIPENKQHPMTLEKSIVMRACKLSGIPPFV